MIIDLRYSTIGQVCAGDFLTTLPHVNYLNYYLLETAKFCQFVPLMNMFFLLTLWFVDKSKYDLAEHVEEVEVDKDQESAAPLLA